MDSPVSGVSLQGQTSIPSIGSTLVSTSLKSSLVSTSLKSSLVSTSLKSSLGSASNTFQGADPASPTTLNAVSGTSAITPSHLMISDSVASSVPSGSVSSTRPASGGGAATQNSTIVLSPLAIDALRLAQFMKNLAVSLANASFTLEQSMDVKAPSSRTDASSSSWSEILRQEREQQQILLRLLGKAGGASVPACEYDLPRNVSSASVLMGTLKSVEAGVFMSLSESISDEDSSATSLLSSMAGAASRQSALLRMHASCNMSSASFETPLSPTWAYNLALNYVRPGSCSVELPVPILPALTVYGGTSAFVRAGMNLTFTWDAAGEAAASRSGKPLHIGWINQVNEPVYTSVLALGDNRGTAQMPPEFAGLAVAVLTAQPGLTSTGDLTDATLAGPVIVHVCR
ncbi:hypothetical protein HBI81_230930 [Parastagonospora nodorum]|nr:hypothetical protein HBI41_254490 [Parastagonospora nodorum]KAH6259682.1 hypothetical protein HBI40_246310 [Parastagonospora nodorum]KAH6512305.1 hypothetical protein HBI81_230930 [Parastagonospora nodorum]